jgi:quercetin dioxygenase-like cupin family protein
MTTTASKIESARAPTGPEGQRYLGTTDRVGMRLWKDEPAGERKPTAKRAYDTVGYVIRGAAELSMDNETVTLRAGDSWVVPAGTKHTYRIVDTFTAIEATSPPAHGIDAR